MSTNGVKYLFSEADDNQSKPVSCMRDLAKSFVIAVGPENSRSPKTIWRTCGYGAAEIQQRRITRSFTKQRYQGQKNSYSTNQQRTPTLTNQLKEMGADVEEIYVYESGLPVDEALKDKFYDRLNRWAHQCHPVRQRVKRQKHLQNAH
jgi:uroporphyrinogen-III synthase